MNKRDQIRDVALEYGWTVRPDAYKECIVLGRQPDPTAPLGGPRLVVDVHFTNEKADRIAWAHYGSGLATRQLSGGLKAILTHLRRNGVKQ